MQELEGCRDAGLPVYFPVSCRSFRNVRSALKQDRGERRRGQKACAQESPSFLQLCSFRNRAGPGRTRGRNKCPSLVLAPSQPLLQGFGPLIIAQLFVSLIHQLRAPVRVRLSEEQSLHPSAWAGLLHERASGSSLWWHRHIGALGQLGAAGARGRAVAGVLAEESGSVCPVPASDSLYNCVLFP